MSIVDYDQVVTETHPRGARAARRIRLIHPKRDERKRRAVNLRQSERGQVRLALERVKRGLGQPGMNSATPTQKRP